MASDCTYMILRIDLTEEKIVSQDVAQHTARKYIGGAGLAARILWDETSPDTDPLSPDNPLLFMIGPLTGTAVPSSSPFLTAANSRPR
jgi:aldehyde:ferredoxin oxidoreductase